MFDIYLQSLLFLSCIINAAVKIGPNLIVLSDSNKMAQVTLTNDSDQKAYVQMEATEVICKDPKQITCRDSQDKQTKISQKITFSNPKFILLPKQQRVVYVMWRDAMPQQNTMFMLTGRDMAATATQTITNGKNNKGGTNFQLKIITLYKSRMLVVKEGASFKEPKASKTPTGINITNPGTAPAQVKIVQYCDSKQISCSKSAGKNMNKTIIKFLNSKETLTNKTPQPGYTTAVSFFDYDNNRWQHLNSFK